MHKVEVQYRATTAILKLWVLMILSEEQRFWAVSFLGASRPASLHQVLRLICNSKKKVLRLVSWQAAWTLINEKKKSLLPL